MIFAAVAIPAQLITPPSVAPDLRVQATVFSTADDTSLSFVMSILKNLTRLGSLVESSGFSFKSSTETNAPASSKAWAVARPRPDELF